MRDLPLSQASGWGIVAAGIIAGLAWAGFYLLVLPPPSGPGVALPWLRTGLGLGLPLMLIGLSTSLAYQLQKLRAEAEALRVALHGAGTRAGSDASPAAETEVTPPGEDPSDAVEPAPRYLQPDSGQDPLPLEPVPGPALSLPDLIRALHFPETPDDRQGLRALSLALRNHRARLVVQAAQDMLTLLSQDGIYVDDLDPTLLPPDAWRRFAGESRKGGAAELAIFAGSDEAARCAARLRNNTVYRDTAHHFLRRFDQMLAEQIPDLSDDAVTAMTATRSARAFLLMGAAAGMFDPA